MWTELLVIAGWVMLAAWLAQLVLIGVPLIAVVLVAWFRAPRRAGQERVAVRAAP
jgi:hypothetical protein